MLNEQEKSNLYSLFIGFNRYLTFKQENPLFLPQEALDFFDLFFYSLYLECCDQKKSLFQIDKKDFFLALIEWEKQFTDLRYFSTYLILMSSLTLSKQLKR